MFRYLQSRIRGTAGPGPGTPPATLGGFYRHFTAQTRGWYAAMFATSLAVALIDTLIPLFIGRLVGMMEATDRAAAIARETPVLLGMLFAVLVLRPLALFVDVAIRHNVLVPGATTLIRWQSHRQVIRQGWAFFQNDFAGRLANRVMQTAQALRESVMAGIRAVWYIGIYGLSALVLLAWADWRLAVPMLAWFAGYVLFLRHFVPRLRELSRASSEVRSQVMARVVDGYTNILTVKLFSRMADEDAWVRESVDAHQDAVAAHMQAITQFMVVLSLLNAGLLAGTGAIGVWLWAQGAVGAATVATALPLAWQIANVAGWVSWEVASIFENVGVVQEGMETIAVPPSGEDRPGARPLEVSRGEIRFEGVRFGYGRTDGSTVLDGLDLVVQPGERVGVVGRSGAGKTTLVNLLLRFFEPEAGRLTIDGQEVREVTQESLRAAIGMVTQDTSLLHRSIADNIRYGRPRASDAEVRAAARRAQADVFIDGLQDWKGRRGYDAHVGERGVKLSGGQRQRVAIARVLLKDAPILILDEATSALDSEVEQAIQEQLAGLMAGKTVIAIAHRLSTIATMDRLVVLDGGRIVETGSHAALLARDGHYAALWRRQSGGFIGDDGRTEPGVAQGSAAG
ncbi:MAG: ABC transporter ATP-binding protein [Burkholderiales bacterium]|nr:MAG: ABC transporter ATP-binding protein [Burkholderiales bacterium]